MLMNVGFKESLKDFPWSCVIVHDVDLLPEVGLEFEFSYINVRNGEEI